MPYNKKLRSYTFYKRRLIRSQMYTEQKKKKGILLAMQPFSVLIESGYMGYEILLTAVFLIGLCNKFRDQSSVTGLSRQ